MIVSIGVLVSIWAVVMLNRNAIRAHYYGYRLARADNAATNIYYFSRLASLGDAAVGPAKRLLANDDANIRSLGAAVLHTAKSDRSRDLLLGALEDTDPEVRRVAVIGLALRHDQAALNPLIEMLAEPTEHPALGAASALERIGGDDAVAALLDATQSHPVTNVRAQAIDSLGWLRASAAIDTLIELLSDGTPVRIETAFDRDLRQTYVTARDGLQMQGVVVEPPTSLPAAGRTIADLAARALRRITNESFDFRSSDPPERKADTIRLWKSWAKRRHAA
jgi:HEAT repeat protein